MSKLDNPAAFPSVKDWGVTTREYIHNEGMTLRDYFAIHAPHDELSCRDPKDGNPINWTQTRRGI